MRRPLYALVLVLACGSKSKNVDHEREHDDDGPPVDYFIVATDALDASAKRWATFRGEEGYVVEERALSELTASTSRAALVSAIQDAVFARYDARDPAKPFFLLLIGDATASTGLPPGTFSSPTDGNVTSDNIYADRDGDNLPDLAVGRIPATSDAMVDNLRERTAAYETSYEVGLWNRRINIFASTSGFGEPADSIVENAAFTIVESISPAYDLTMTYAKQSSPYVFVPEHFSDKVYERMNEGALMVAYVGHGLPDSFDLLEWNGHYFDILDTQSLAPLSPAHKAPILCFIACSTGSFDTGDSVSERVLEAPGAPVAVLSSTEVSHPVPNGMFVYELSHTLTDEGPATLGEAFARAKVRLFENNDPVRQELALFGDLYLGDDAADIYESHAHMYTLFGDPALEIAYVGKALLSAPAITTAGAALAFTAELGALGPGSAHVTFESQRQVISGDILPVPADGSPDRDTTIAANYATANDKVLASLDLPHNGGTLEGSIDVPSELPSGTYYLKIYADDGAIDAAGGAAVEIR